MIRDDGVIVYIDGVEVLRDNVVEGPQTLDLRAQQSTASEASERSYVLDRALSAGEHTLVISLHNHGTSSSDLRIANVVLSGRRP